MYLLLDLKPIRRLQSRIRVCGQYRQEMCIYHSCPWQCDQLSSFLQPNKLDFHCTQTWAPFCRMAFSLENEKEIAYYLTRESHVTTKGKPNMKDRKKFHRYFLWKKKKKNNYPLHPLVGWGNYVSCLSKSQTSWTNFAIFAKHWSYCA